MLILERPDAAGGTARPTRLFPPTDGLVLGVTGHRPHKLVPKPHCYSKPFRVHLIQFATGWLKELKPEQVISGMALGWDQAVALAAIKLDIPLVAAVPFQGQDARWPAPSQRLYRKILARAHHVKVISPGGYSHQAMQTRNEWIVNHSHQLLALCNPARPGGSNNCLAYANQQCIPVTHCWEAFKLKF